jgi:transcriptional regulator GlxA family with amidase domain
VYLVANPAASSYRRLPLLARLGADDVFFVTPTDADRLVETLARSTCVLGIVGPQPALLANTWEVAAHLTPTVATMLAMLERDPCPPWRVAELYRRMAVHERTVERHAKAVHLTVAALHRTRLIQRASAMKRAGLSWPDIAWLLEAPSTAALRARVARARTAE